ncbi:MAG TPA: hypothetical protein VKV03_11520 [Candidatus Binataceae bacterium]|nr:hypothetical protein [Candidatus Binataceae bacterium]
MKWVLAVAMLALAGCAATRSMHSQGQQGSAYHPPDLSNSATLQSTGTPPPTSGPIPVSLTADGFFTPEGMRIAFLRECAEDTLKNKYDSFALFHYKMAQTAPRKFEAHGEIIESRGHYDDRSKGVFDARKVLADKGF